MASGRGRRRGPARSGSPVKIALEAWRALCRDCYPCHAARGHSALYCDAGWALASEVSKARTAVRVATGIRARNQGTLL